MFRRSLFFRVDLTDDVPPSALRLYFPRTCFFFSSTAGFPLNYCKNQRERRFEIYLTCFVFMYFGNQMPSWLMIFSVVKEWVQNVSLLAFFFCMEGHWAYTTSLIEVQGPSVFFRTFATRDCLEVTSLFTQPSFKGFPGLKPPLNVSHKAEGDNFLAVCKFSQKRKRNHEVWSHREKHQGRTARLVYLFSEHLVLCT